jgi:hypothetical protein
MQIRNRFSINRASRHAVASLSLAALVLTGGLLKADDTTQQTDSAKSTATVNKQGATANGTDKDAKAISDSASKLDFSKPVTKLNFYGSATVGYVTAFGKNSHQGGMFSELQLGTDIHLSKDVTMSLLLGTGRYPNGFGLLR